MEETAGVALAIIFGLGFPVLVCVAIGLIIEKKDALHAKGEEQ